MKEKKYLNVATGSVDTREGWNYVDEKGEEVNAVDLGEVVPVCWNNETGSWEDLTYKPLSTPLGDFLLSDEPEEGE